VNRDKSGRFSKPPNALFKSGEIVFKKMNKNDEGCLVTIKSVSHNQERGWIYGVLYAKEYENSIVSEGGGSFWWNQDQVFKLNNPTTKIKAEVFYREREKLQIESRLTQINKELEHLKFSLETVK